MAITTAMCTSFKKNLAEALMDFSATTAQTFKIALYTSSATMSDTTTAYSATNEVSGTGYTAGGATLTISTNPATSGTTAYWSFSNVTWTSATITARGCMIYKSGGANSAIAVYDFGADKVASGGNFVIQFPTADASNAVLRVQ